MSNVNSIAGFVNGTGRNQIPTTTVTVASETNITVNTDTGTAVAILAVPGQTAIVGAQTPLSPNSNPTIIGQGTQPYGPYEGSNAPFYNSGSFDGRPFRIRITGTATSAAAASQTLQFKLYLGTSKAGTSLIALPAAAFTGVATAGTYSFLLDATFLWDSTSQLLNGYATINIGNVTSTNVAITQATAVTLANLQFNASFTTAVAGSVALTVKDFSMDLV